MSFYDRMYAQVAQIEAATAAIGQAHAEQQARTCTQEIAGGLGSVTVAGGGELRSVDLEPRAIVGASGSVLGAAVLAAIAAAEARLAAEYRQRMDDARQQART